MLRTRHFVNSDVCGRCLNPTERRTRQTDSVTPDPSIYIYIYIYVCSCRSISLGFVKLSVWFKYACKYLDIYIYIYIYLLQQFGLSGKHFRNEVFALLRSCTAPIGCTFPTFRDSVSVLKRRLSNYQLTLRNFPEEPRTSLLLGESLKSDNSDFYSGHFQVSTRPGNRLSFFGFFIHFFQSLQENMAIET